MSLQKTEASAGTAHIFLKRVNFNLCFACLKRQLLFHCFHFSSIFLYVLFLVLHAPFSTWGFFWVPWGPQKEPPQPLRSCFWLFIRISSRVESSSSSIGPGYSLGVPQWAPHHVLARAGQRVLMAVSLTGRGSGIGISSRLVKCWSARSRLIDSSYSESTLIFQHFSRSTRSDKICILLRRRSTFFCRKLSFFSRTRLRQIEREVWKDKSRT